MSAEVHDLPVAWNLDARGRGIFEAQLTLIHRRTDRLFVWLMLAQWAASIIGALVILPRIWTGDSGSVNFHAGASILLGGLIVSLPIALAVYRPGDAMTRHAMAVAQMLMSGLLIHLTGGRIETHFHVFGSLAFLAFYRDPWVLVTATIVTAADHAIRSVFWPMSIFGLASGVPWRAVEHAAWVIFEDIFLWVAISQNRRQLAQVAQRQSRLSALNGRVEQQVATRTEQLSEALRAQRQTAQELRESHESFRALTENSPDAVARFDRQLRFVYLNAMVERFIGRRREELLGRSLLELGLPSRPEVQAALKRALITGAKQQVDYEFETPAGVRCFSAVIVPETEASGSTEYLLSVTRDVTETRQTLIELQEARTRFDLAVQGSHDGIWDWNLITNDVFFSPRFKELLGFEDHEFPSGHSAWAERVHPDDLGPTQATRRLYLDRQTPSYSVEYRMRHRDGSYRWFHGRGVGGWDESGRAVRFTGAVSDITDRKRHEEELLRAKEEAETANHAKSDFLATMSHEIRTPLNAILGMNELLAETGLNEKQRRYVAMANEAGRGLLAVINDILDFSRIEAGKLPLDPVPFDPWQMIEEIAGLLGQRADRKNLELLVRVPPSVPRNCLGAAPRIRQVLLNLADNAVKFTDHGSVLIEAEARSVGAASMELRFTVSDTGIGIPVEQHSRLFKKFSQADSSRTRRFTGSGLGLAICKRLVELLGGEIGFVSTGGEGARFWFTVTVGVQSAVVTPAPSRDLAAWVVVAEAAARSNLGRVLQDAGAEVELYASASLARLQAEGRGNLPESVWVDLALESAEVTALARALHAAAPHALIVGVGTPEQISVIEAARNQTFASILPKPVRPSAVFALVSECPAGGSREKNVAPLTRAPGRRGRVLVAEDHPPNQVIAIAVLENLGCEVVLAGDGFAAVAEVSKSKFDLIFMDCHMPKLDGFGATALIRREHSAVPIIAVTADAVIGDRERCLAAGMTDYLCKPVTKAGFELMLKRWLPVAKRPTARVESIEYNHRDALELVDGDRGLLRRMVASFCNTAGDVPARLHAAIEAQDHLAVVLLAHSTKGAARLFAAKPLETAAQALESAAKAQDWQALPDLAATMIQRLATLLPELETLLNE
jgi:PAS domain S-box-containing protein